MVYDSFLNGNNLFLFFPRLINCNFDAKTSRIFKEDATLIGNRIIFETCEWTCSMTKYRWIRELISCWLKFHRSNSWKIYHKETRCSLWMIIFWKYEIPIGFLMRRCFISSIFQINIFTFNKIMNTHNFIENSLSKIHFFKFLIP